MIRVLLAEDDRLITHLLSAFLTRMGHQVESVATVAAATARLSGEPDLDLVLLDVNMPDGRAHDVLRRLEGHVVPPILLLTGSRSEELEELLRDPRVRGVVSKPVTPDALAAGMEEALGSPEIS